MYRCVCASVCVCVCVLCICCMVCRVTCVICSDALIYIYFSVMRFERWKAQYKFPLLLLSEIGGVARKEREKQEDES